ncbi:MAG: class IV adenylate cyclase [Cyclobacteriaceae bacterium]
MGFINIEIKAVCRDQAKIEALLHSRLADFRGEDHQVDTYFKVQKGRLKLREGKIENALIAYERQNLAGPKKSDISLYKSKAAKELKEVLSQALDVLVVVDKKRKIFFIDNVKFHLDRVEGLGSFVEIEAIDYEGNIGEEKLRQQLDTYLHLFDITDSDLLEVSYSDMLLAQQ